MRTIVIDSDPGVDDALAIFLAVRSPGLNVVGITSVFGNAPVAVTTHNALCLLDLAGRPDVPVAAGAAQPIASARRPAPSHIHGANGQGGAPIPVPSRPVSAQPAAEFLYRAAMQHPGELTILTLGPLTNLALAARLHVDLPELVAEVVVMGGNAFVPGNASPAAEANMLNDPEAADIVFGLGWPVTMVGLDVTHRVILPTAAIQRLTATQSATGRHLAAALPMYHQFFQRTNGIDGIYLHDPTAVAFLDDPSLFRTARYPVRVETASISRGKTWPALGDTDDAAPAPWQDRPPVTICTDVVADEVVDLLISRLA